MEAMEELVQLSDSMLQATALLDDEDVDEPSRRRASTFMNVVALGNVGAGKSATLNSLIGHPVLPTGENGATRAPICIDLQRDSSLSSKVLVLQIDSRSQQVSASALRHSLQDRLSKGAAAQSSGKGRPEEIYMKLCTSAAMGVDETPSISMKKKHSLDALEQRFAKTNSPNQVQVGNQNLLALASGSPFSSVPVTGLVLHACSNKQISKGKKSEMRWKGVGLTGHTTMVLL